MSWQGASAGASVGIAAFSYDYVAVEGEVGMLEWSYEDSTVQVRDGVDSYVIRRGKIVAQTIRYTVEPK